MGNLDFRQVVEDVVVKLQLSEEEKEAMRASSISPKKEKSELDASDLDKIALNILNSSSL